MRKKVQNIMVAVCVTIQVLTMLAYSFTELQISAYAYMAVWSICGMVVYDSTRSDESEEIR